MLPYVGFVASLLQSLLPLVAPPFVSRHNTRAQITKSLLDDYASQEMTEALSFFGQVWRGQPPQIAESEFGSPEVLKHAPERITQINSVRRPISHYFQKVYSLYKAKMIDLTIVQTVANKKQAKFYLDWLEGLGRLAGRYTGGYDESSFKFYAELYNLPRSKAPPSDSELEI